jgi:arylsulfatase A-like enzyme
MGVKLLQDLLKPGPSLAIKAIVPLPNGLFISADDMGCGDFSRFNHGLSRTPALDSLIDEPLCFTQQYTASPVCNPSRSSGETGCHVRSGAFHRPGVKRVLRELEGVGHR